jgi:hypothetical protein
MKRLSWLLLILTLVACGPAGVVTPTVTPSPSSTPVTPSSASASEIFFGNSSCSWPCWQGITPGVTKSSDALQLLQASPAVSKSTIRSEERKPGFGTARWYWGIGSNLFGCDLEWRDGIVSRINLTAFSKFSIGEIMDRFGSPEKVSVIDCEMTPEQPREWCADFYYVKRGFEIRLKWDMSEHADDVRLSPSDPIRSVYLLGPSGIEDLLSYLGGGRNPVDIRDWKGYGNLLELYVR